MAVVSNKIENVYPLTPLQEGMLFHHLANPDSTEYILQYGHKVEFDIDNEYVEKALALISTKYSALRTAFAYKKTKEIYQVVLAEREIEFNYVDIEQVNDDEKNNEIEKLLTNDVNRGFDLMKDSLLRVIRVKYGSEDNRLIFTFHHIIVDGWCIGIVMNGFWDYYNSLCNGVTYDELLNNVKHEKETSNDYSDYIKWLIKQDKEKAKNFWANELLDYDSEAKIEALQKPEKTGNQMKKYTGSVDFDCTEKIKELSKNNNATINTAAEVAVGILLQRYSGSNDVVFGKVVSGRNAPINGIEKMVGLFINTIPVRVNIDDKTTVAELLKTQQKKGNECTGFDYYSLAEIQNNTKQGSNLINVIFVYENYMSGQESDSYDENGNQLKIEYAREQTNYGITISATEIDNKLSFQILYDPNQYCDEEVKLIMDRLLKICEEIAVDPLNKVSEIDAIDEKEKNVILTEFNNVQVDYPRNKTIAEIFE
ncbi:MAG TPA: non-ribosomal peptide synthetase, partial [Eubacterium sp.]|nr:non-ribosomal peptide synthetase [Eubacterium sp.]